ncbi:MAG TPA: helix-turn-helix transcriptional regulator [Streptosporangiaceae bacterium]
MATTKELGRFLRARRARLQPTDVGLPAGTGLRRTPGLRREELAALAGISIDYYIRLEQGRETNPSNAVLEALARSLRLDHAEHTHLFNLANHAAHRQPCAPAVARTVRPGLRQLLDSVRPSPAYVMSRINDIHAANPEGLALLPGIEDWPPDRRNTIRYLFLHPASRGLYEDWDWVAAGSVAHLRSVLAIDPDDPELAALVDELNAACAEFAALWERYDVGRRRHGQKTFHHPQVGRITLTAEVLHLTETGQRVTIYQATPGSADHDAISLLSVAASIR